MTELNKGEMRFARGERGWYDRLQIWTGTEWRDVEAGGQLAGAVLPSPSPAVGGRFETLKKGFESQS